MYALKQIPTCRITIEVLQKNKKRVAEKPNLCYIYSHFLKSSHRTAAEKLEELFE